ncbi:hypothetical protein DPMN_186649 [Dreissena polymorpha]|uniref:AP-3 complex subunit beta-1/2 C-terminal domain-containing protein n=2 Tax=Dreissena polymorpha TaxID=45954 RepID=A0A9D4HQP2_DREPO|nr:hypothetical protein DPMN_051868 [Dreissena polymorpha]KAH3752041.1 hypothetical protein DPMN_186649 [Dreissena polymorpha]
MNENSTKVKLPADKSDMKSIVTAVLKVANVLQVPSAEENKFLFAARTLATQTLVLISVDTKNGAAKLTTNCEKMVIGAMLMKDVKGSLEG